MAVGWETVAREVDVVANALRAVAVVAYAVETAGCVAAQACRVDGRCRVAGTGKSRLDGRCHLVHPNDVDYIVWSPSDSSNTVSSSVNIDDDAVLGDGIGAGEEIIHVHRIEIALACLFGCLCQVTVDNLVVAAVDDVLCEPHLAYGL